jgi:hypothetical protein
MRVLDDWLLTAERIAVHWPSQTAIVADALEEAGCSDEQILGHLRSGGEHYRGCFVVDALLGKS